MWFLPYLHVRTAGESWGGSFLFLAIALTTLFSQKEKKQTDLPVWSALLVGTLLGLSFDVRYQMVFCVLGFGLWCLISARMRPSKQGVIVGSSVVAMLAAALVDRWGYGEWSAPAWNYFRSQILELPMQSPTPAALVLDTDRGPFWFYLQKTLESAPPIGALLLFAAVWVWVRKPSHILTLTSVPLIVAHSLLGHKEYRYVFPLANAAPLFLALAGEALSSRWKGMISRWRWVVLVPNAIALLYASVRPSFAPVNWYYHFLNHHPDVKTLYFTRETPYQMIFTPVNFYKPDGLYTEWVGIRGDRHARLDNLKKGRGHLALSQ
jgi:phosphatidylinositol glycan class B